MGFEDYIANDLDSSINYLIRYGEPHPYYYNCSNIKDPFAIGMKRPFWGFYFLITGIILMAIYIPCLYVISRSDLMKSSCYKIMFFLGFLDLCCLSCNSISTGYLGIIGATYCSYPRFIFFMGGLGCGCWMGSCSTCIVLAINRCCDINHNLSFRKIFIGKNIYITMMFPFIYSIYSVFFCKPILFNSNYMSWFFNPEIGLEKQNYISIAHTVNNCVVSVCTTCLYGYLCVLLFFKNRHAQSDSLSKTQKQIFLQSIMICSFNAIAAYIYVYMQFFYSPPTVILIGQLAWQFAHGSVGLVYITMNRSVRRKVFEILIPGFIRSGMRGQTGTTISRPVVSAVGIEPKGNHITATSSGTVF
ncbi:unnamed protein product [Caenorhabditis angaria]|uniref:Serpentine Receptor, class T n=1 Tax=Caenorhabditis angaria TaxID=860376 RepID=A0A9P1N5P3_9PELO|nr:unnamed protein product [Caenorhabditis angaria]